MKEFELIIDVAPSDIDANNHVNNLVYLRWGAQVADAHVAALAQNVDHAGIGWVVIRHEIDYKKAALLGDRIRLHTRLGLAKGLAFPRHTGIYRLSDQVHLAEIVSTYCPIVLGSNKPLKVSAAFRAAYS